MDEIWKPIKRAPGYEVSNLGRIRSFMKGKNGHIMSPCTFSCNRLGVYLRINKKKSIAYIHKEVATAFLGKRPEGMVTRHLDGNVTNNCLNNLAYGTQLDNMADARRHKTIACGNKLPQAKLNPRKVRIIRKLREIGFTVPRLSQIFGVSLRNIYRVIRRQSWAHVE